MGGEGGGRIHHIAVLGLTYVGRPRGRGAVESGFDLCEVYW